MASERLLPLRRRVVEGAAGRVLELGIGSGANLSFYGREVSGLQGIDPAAYLLDRARQSADWLPFPVHLIEQSAEHLPLADACVDTVVVTWALCTIPDPLAALREAHRAWCPGAACGSSSTACRRWPASPAGNAGSRRHGGGSPAAVASTSGPTACSPGQGSRSSSWRPVTWRRGPGC